MTWDKNNVQFPRLLAEVHGVLTTAQYDELAASMDLPRHRIDELFDRAIARWEEIKQRGKAARAEYRP